MSDEGKFLAAAHKPGRPRGKLTGGYIEIDALPEVVWSIVGDYPSWGDWNQLYIRTSGQPKVGGAIEMTVQLEGMPEMNMKAKVLTYLPGECFEYSLKQFGGLLKAYRFIDLEEIAPGRTGLVNGEIQSGLLAGIVASKTGQKVTDAFTVMNRQIKEMAEAKAAAAPPS